MTIGGVIAAVTAAGGAWTAMHSDMMPVTKARHNADLQQIIDVLERNQAEWRCDEYSEELAELLLIEEPNGTQRERIRVLRRLMDENRCERFEG